MQVKSNNSKQRGEHTVSQTRRVLMLDLLPTVPYYTEHLCAALENCPEVQVSLAATTYSHDSTCFGNMRTHRRQGLLNFAARMPNSAKPARRAFKFIEYLLNLGALAVQFLFSAPDVVHIQFAPLIDLGLSFDIWLLKLARALGCRIVYTVHNVLPHEGGERFRHLYAKVYELADHLICHNEPAKAAVSATFQVPPEKITIIPHGPLFSPFIRCTQGQARTRLGLPAGALIVLWQGIIRPYKGVSFLLKAWKQARQTGLDATLVIVGTGDRAELEAVTNQVKELDIASSVRLDFRFVDVPTLKDYLSAADILVYPYAAITTSGALMTGMNYGKAVIASALPAFQEVLQHGDSGLLVPHDSLDGWASALLQLASDADLRNRLGKNLQQSSAARLNWGDIGSKTVRVYQRALTPITQAQISTLDRITAAPRG